MNSLIWVSNWQWYGGFQLKLSLRWTVWIYSIMLEKFLFGIFLFYVYSYSAFKLQLAHSNLLTIQENVFIWGSLLRFTAADLLICKIWSHCNKYVENNAACSWSLKCPVFENTLVIDIFSISCKTATRWLPHTYQSTLVQVMAWCWHTASHYIKPCWPRFMMQYGITMPWCINPVSQELHPPHPTRFIQC